MRLLIKLTISILLGYFIFFGIVGPSLYTKAVESIKDEVKEHLVTVRDLKKLELEEYFFERRGDLMVLSKDPMVVESLPLFIDSFNSEGLGSKEYINAEKEYKDCLSYYAKTYGYEDLFLVDIDGNVVFAAVNESHLGINLLDVEFIDPMIPDIFIQGRTKIAFSDYVWLETFKELTAFGAAPVRDRRGDVMGVLMFQLSFNEIDNIMLKRPGLGKTGETYIVGEDKLMRSDSRFVEGTTADILRVDTVATKEAVKGHAGVEIINDYRGEQVISAFAPLEIEHLKWSIIAEIDVDEAFRSIYKLKTLMFAVFGILVVAIGIYGYLAYKKEMKLADEEDQQIENDMKNEVENVGLEKQNQVYE